MNSHLCSICGRKACCELTSSGCAPVTYKACPACRAEGAENIDVAITWVHLFGGPDTAPEHKTRLVAWLDGGYVGWPEIQAHYTENQDALIALEAEEYELVDDLSPTNYGTDGTDEGT